MNARSPAASNTSTRLNHRAPERTTEEFLDELRHEDALQSEYRDLLAEFLRHCDLVKFAALEPTEIDVKRTFETCRDFVDATKREEVEVEV